MGFLFPQESLLIWIKWRTKLLDITSMSPEECDGSRLTGIKDAACSCSCGFPSRQHICAFDVESVHPVQC